MHSSFDDLITGLCALTDYPAPLKIIAGEGIEFEGVNFAIICKQKSDPDALFLYADFGWLDLEQQAMLYPLMLKENFMMLGSRECTFGVSKLLDSVVLIEKVRLSQTSPESLLILMRSLARRANYFCKHHRAGASLTKRPAPRVRSAARLNITA